MLTDMKSNNIIFYHCSTECGNFGDAIINRNLLKLLRNYGKILLNDKKIPESFLNQLALRPEERVSKNTPNFLLTILGYAYKSRFHRNQNIYLFFPPGHLFSLDNEKKLSIILFSAYMFIARCLGVRICRVGFSMGSFSRAKKIVEFMNAKLMYLYGIRDSLSESYAHSIGVTNTTRFPDLSLIDIDTNKSLFSTKLTKHIHKKKYIVFSCCQSVPAVLSQVEVENETIKALDEIVAKFCHNQEYKLLLCYQVAKDKKFILKLKERYKSSVSLELIDRQLTEDDCADIYGNAELVFTNRLHVALLALVNGGLSIALIDPIIHSKISGIFRDASLQMLIFDLRESPKHQIEKLENILSNADEIKTIFHSYHKRNACEARQQIQLLFEGQQTQKER